MATPWPMFAFLIGVMLVVWIVGRSADCKAPTPPPPKPGAAKRPVKVYVLSEYRARRAVIQQDCKLRKVA